MATNSTPSEQTVDLRDGYDLSIYGLDNGQFYYIHVPALICISVSFICVVTTIVLSFRRRRCRDFFSGWSKSERFIVYLAICDGLYNVFHFTDHMHVLVAKNHVYPKELCEFYGFTLVVAISSQNLMVNVVAINAFMLMFFDKKLDFGRYDLKMLAYTFGIPILGAVISASLGQLGPNGAFCYFDGVNGKVAKTFFTTVALLLILFVNIILYTLTWKRIHEQTTRLRRSMRSMTSTMKTSHRAARAMLLFVAAFFIQWWSMVLYGIWDLADEANVPQAVVHFVTTFTNIGGVLNLIVFLIIRRRLYQQERANTSSKVTLSKEMSSNEAASDTPNT